MTDSITLLTTLGGLPLAKTWQEDGTIKGYGRQLEDGTTVGAKRYTMSRSEVRSLSDLHKVLDDIRGWSDMCAIRGEYNGHPLEKGSTVLRRKAFFDDVPHHWVMFDVDGWSDGTEYATPGQAFDAWTMATLPTEFHGVDCIWHLSGSAGHPSKPSNELRGHIWFWLETPYDSKTLRAWVTASGLATAIDRSVLDSVQVHYTADPIRQDGGSFEAGERMGFSSGWFGADVSLVIDPEMIADTVLRQDASESGFADPREKKGAIGAFCRAFSPAEVLTAEWFEASADFEQVTEARWTWLGGNGAQEGVRIDSTGFVNTHNSAPHDTFCTRLNVFDIVRVYMFGELDEEILAGADAWTIQAEPWTAPSYKAAMSFVKTFAEVQHEIDAEREERGMNTAVAGVDTEIAGVDTAVAGVDTEIAGVDTKIAVTEAPKKVKDTWGVAMLDACEVVLSLAGCDKAEAALIIQRAAVTAAWRGVFFSSKNNKIHMINRAGALVEFPAKDWRKAITMTFGQLWDYNALVAAAAVHENDVDRRPAWVDARKKELWGVFERHVQLYRQRTTISYEVDMFATTDKMEIMPESVKVTFKHIPFKRQNEGVELTDAERAAIVQEFIAHLPFVARFPELLLHARFAADRRKAFTWLKLASSMGKGFLFQGVLGRDGLSLVAGISAKEIERAFEGNPLGIDPAMIYRAWVIWIDEFKSAKSEIKQLNNTIMITPKHGMRSEVPTYLKAFTSAEGVDSFAGSEGVEAQFAERFSYVEIDGGRLDDLPEFQRHGRMVYRAVLANWFGERINAGVEMMRALGAVEASRVSDRGLDRWHADHGISLSHDSLDDSIDGYADELRELINDWGRFMVDDVTPRMRTLPNGLKNALATYVKVEWGNRSKKKLEAGEKELLAVVTRPVAFVKAWIGLTIDRSQQILVGHKAKKIADALSGEDSSKTRRYITADGSEIVCKAQIISVQHISLGKTG